jgi:beta-lactam-binding protein with PASTA domain
LIKRIFKIAALFSVTAIVFGASAYFTLNFIVKSEDTVVVPDLVEKDVIYALEILTEIGLNTKVKRSEYNSDIPKNHVIFQDPAPGAEIKKGRDVRIVISKGAKTISMPNLKRLSVQQALIILEENGLRLGEKSLSFNNAIIKDDVVEHLPSPGSPVKRGESVNLLVSLGPLPKAYKMPDLEGLSIEDAILLIERDNLAVGEIKSFFYEAKPKNVVAGQEPLSGHRVIEGSTVNIIINREPKKNDQRYSAGLGGVGLFRYRIETGFLKRHIKVRLNSFSVSSDLFDDFMKPGEEIWVLVPKNNDATVILYRDGAIVKSEVFD